MKHLTCMGQGLVGKCHAAQHPRQLANPAAFVQQRHVGERGVSLGALFDVQMLVRLGSHLRQVGYGHYLAVFA